MIVTGQAKMLKSKNGFFVKSEYGTPIFQSTVSDDKQKEITEPEIINHVNKFIAKVKQAMPGNEYMFKVFSSSKENGYFTTSWFSKELKTLELDSGLAFNNVKWFCIQFYKKFRGGGGDNNNDCFFTALGLTKEEYDTIKQKSYRLPGFFKQKMGLKRDSFITFKEIDKWEEKTGIAVFVYGDKLRVPKIKDYKIVKHIKLSNNHYTSRSTSPETWKVRKMLYNKSINKLVVCDNKPLKGDKNSGVYYSFFDKKKYETKEEQYDCLMKKRENILNATGIDIMHHKFDDCKVALHWFYLLNNNIKEFETLNVEENYLINDSFGGGIKWTNKEYEGESVEYDVNSAYYYLLENKRFPCGPGEFKTVESLDFKKLEYGLYRCNIEKKGNEMDNMFSWKKWITHVELQDFFKYGYNIEIVKKPNNCYIYKNLVKGRDYFCKYNDKFYELKGKCNEMKKIYTMLWGSLCQRKVAYGSNKDSDLIVDGELLKTTEKDDGDYHLCKYVRYDDRYESPYARIGPFLTSFQRQRLRFFISKCDVNDLVKYNTDCVVLKKESDYFNSLISPCLGDMKKKCGVIKNGKLTCE